MEQARHQRWLSRHRPNEKGAREELIEHQANLAMIPIERRKAIVGDPFGTPLEDVRAIFELEQVSGVSCIAPPSQFDLSAAHERVAATASRHFRKRITKRQVKRCMQAWRSLEAELGD